MLNYECTVKSGEYNLTTISNNTLKKIKEEIEKFLIDDTNQNLKDYILENGLWFYVFNKNNKMVYECNKNIEKMNESGEQ